MPELDPGRLPVLKLGSRGKAVTAAKLAVNEWNAKKGNTSAFFGPFFRSLVKQFQKEHRIPQTGVVGVNTWKALAPFLTPAAKKLLPQKPDVPNLGPVFKGGKSVLDHDLTHATDGIPLYPAFDDAFSRGLTIIAPEPLIVTRASSSRPGCAFYCQGQSGIRYWFGHLAADQPVGKEFAKGAAIGRVGANNIGGGPHVHVGVNVEVLWGKGRELVYHTNYTHGAPTIGAQLAARSAI